MRSTYALRMDGVLRSGRFVAWGNAVLAGLVSPDTAADRIIGAGAVHRVLGASTLAPQLAALTGGDDQTSLPMVLAALRPAGVSALILALPVPGDPGGLPGPADFNARAMAAGEAVLTVGATPCGLIPHPVPEDLDAANSTGTLWLVERVEPPVALDLPSLAEAEWDLAETMRAATDALARLDVARWRPEAADRIGAIRSGAGADVLAPGYPDRAHRVLAMAQRVSAITSLAVEDGGAAVSAAAIAMRADELRPLARAARRAQLAAYNAMPETRV